MPSSIILPSEARDDIIELCDIIAPRADILAFQAIPWTPKDRSLPRRPYLAFLEHTEERNINQFRFEDRAAVRTPDEYQESLHEEYGIDMLTDIELYRIPSCTSGVKLRVHMPHHARLWQYAIERGMSFDADRAPWRF